jgi:hypothetical protein
MDGFDRIFGQPTAAAVDGADAREPVSERGRDSLFLTASLWLGNDDTPREVRIRNLSAGGMMAELSVVVPAGMTVRLDVRGIGDVSGRVAWCTAGRIGIALDQQIDPKRARKPVTGGTKTPFYAKSVPR